MAVCSGSQAIRKWHKLVFEERSFGGPREAADKVGRSSSGVLGLGRGICFAAGLLILINQQNIPNFFFLQHIFVQNLVPLQEILVLHLEMVSPLLFPPIFHDPSPSSLCAGLPIVLKDNKTFMGQIVGQGIGASLLGVLQILNLRCAHCLIKYMLNLA